MIEGLRLTLPRSAALTEALLAPPAGNLDSRWIQELRARLLRELPPLAEMIPHDERLQIGSFELALARDRPEACAARYRGDRFAPSAALTRRAVGLAAVERCVRGRSAVPQTAVAEVLDSGLEDLVESRRSEGAPRAPWWAEWYESLGPGGRATVLAEAVTWATQLWTALDWSRFDRPAVIGGRDDFWDCPGRRQLSVRGRAEVRAFAGDRRVTLVTGTRYPGPAWRAELAHRALVVAMSRAESSVPARVVGFWPSSGMVRICEVDASALSEAADALVSGVATWVGAIWRPHMRGSVAC